MQVHAIVPASRANGPGLRTVVWFQGCQRMNCPGCWNPETHEFKGFYQWPDQIARRLYYEVEANQGVDGVTFSGGEPMQQAWSLACLLVELRYRMPGVSFGMFTGYTEAELENGLYQIIENVPHTLGPMQRRLLWLDIRGHLDFAVTGRYNRLQPCSEGLLSSRNQVLRLFSDRYTLADFGEQLAEVRINEDGLVQVTGFPVLGVPA